MKLVDILAEKWTVWPYPEDAFVSQDADKDACAFLSGNQTCNSYGNWNGDSYVSNSLIRLPKIATDQRTAVITRAQWQAAVDALKAEAAPAWVGVGLPPIGTVCEYHVGNGPWFKGEIRYLISPISGQPKEVVLFASHLKGEQVGVIGTGEGEVSFRPICTPEQISAEEREREIELAVQMINKKPFCQNSIAVQNGIRHAVGEMITAGYRKFEIVDKDDGEGV